MCNGFDSLFLQTAIQSRDETPKNWSVAQNYIDSTWKILFLLPNEIWIFVTNINIS